ncbi:Olfactory receptor 143 [Tupaia chinensis]|uniref:Olfactory receptor 143 n=1 Tax=Tupaia chinensis TaxID=246437 RepID=L9LBZ6_TUPCH|nr:Olfactory receptor 143 [Tupaia chinensis]
MLVSFMSEKNFISFTGCMAQLFLFCLFVHSECHVLTVMAYDHYVAIWKPLLYTATMYPQACARLLGSCYVMGLQVSCSSTYADELMDSGTVTTVVIASSLVICISQGLGDFFSQQSTMEVMPGAMCKVRSRADTASGAAKVQWWHVTTRGQSGTFQVHTVPKVWVG